MKKGENLRKINYNETLFDIPVFSQIVEYNPKTLLEEKEQWFFIKNFSKQAYFSREICECVNNTCNLPTLDKTEISSMEYICSFQDNNYFCFQKIRYKQSLLKKKIIFNFKNDFMLWKNEFIVINEFPDAVYVKDEDIVYFKKLETISTIFKGIDELYREATNEEIEEFLKKDFISTETNLTVARIGKLSRKRIAMANTILEGFNEEDRSEILEYVKENSGLKLDNNNSFIIDNEDDIKKFFWGIDERYYMTPVSKKKIIANSVIGFDTKSIKDD